MKKLFLLLSFVAFLAAFSNMNAQLVRYTDYDYNTGTSYNFAKMQFIAFDARDGVYMMTTRNLDSLYVMILDINFNPIRAFNYINPYDPAGDEVTPTEIVYNEARRCFVIIGHRAGTSPYIFIVELDPAGNILYDWKFENSSTDFMKNIVIANGYYCFADGNTVTLFDPSTQSIQWKKQLDIEANITDLVVHDDNIYGVGTYNTKEANFLIYINYDFAGTLVDNKEYLVTREYQLLTWAYCDIAETPEGDKLYTIFNWGDDVNQVDYTLAWIDITNSNNYQFVNNYSPEYEFTIVRDIHAYRDYIYVDGWSQNDPPYERVNGYISQHAFDLGLVYSRVYEYYMNYGFFLGQIFNNPLTGSVAITAGRIDESTGTTIPHLYIVDAIDNPSHNCEERRIDLEQRKIEVRADMFNDFEIEHKLDKNRHRKYEKKVEIKEVCINDYKSDGKEKEPVVTPQTISSSINVNESEITFGNLNGEVYNIYTITGFDISNGIVNGNSIELSNFATGCYIITIIKADGTRLSEKFSVIK